jgi:hypothetical protein
MTEDQYTIPAKEKTPSQWATEDGIWRPITGSVRHGLAPNMYELLALQSQSGIQVLLKEMDSLQTDRLLSIPGSLAEYIIGLVNHFWDNQELYGKMGLVHKRGVMLEGNPGSGKTATALLVGKEIVKRGGISILTSPNTEIAVLGSLLKKIREIQPTIPILNIMEDIDKHKRSMDVLLPVLDGENQVSNIFHIATTNFIEKMDARIWNRPSRFDEIIKVSSPNAIARAAYLDAVLPKDLDRKILEQLVPASDGLMFAHLKELAICTVVYGHPIEKTVIRLKKMVEKAGTGFNNAEDEPEEPVRFRNYHGGLLGMLLGPPEIENATGQKK